MAIYIPGEKFMKRRNALVLLVWFGCSLVARGQELPLTAEGKRLDLFAAQPSGTALPDVLAPKFEKKSIGLAILYSLAVPGMGELYAGGFASGKYFLGAEAALWTTYTVISVRGNSLKDDGRAFAAVHAGLVNPGSKDDQFFVDISNFLNVDDYNAKKLRDRNLAAVYDPAAGYGWSWDSESNRGAFRDLRVRADDVLNNRKFVVMGILLNHLASAINAARTAISHNNDVSSGLGELQLGANVLQGPMGVHGVSVQLIKSF
jgi:hypothetical protein